MIRRVLVLAALPLLLLGCGRSGSYNGYTPMMALHARADRNDENQSFSFMHDLTLAMAHERIRPRFERAQARCLKDASLHCKLISSSYDSSDLESGGPAGAFLGVALPHDKIDAFEHGLTAPLPGESASAVTVQSRSTSAQNVGQEAGDAARKVARLIAYRDRLAEIAKRTNLSVDDLIKVEGELSKAQSDLDDATSAAGDVGDRLARERLSVTLSERPGMGDAFAPVGRTWRDAVSLLGESTAGALQFVIQIIPWLPIVVGLLFLVRLLWRRSRRKKD